MIRTSPSRPALRALGWLAGPALVLAASSPSAALSGTLCIVRVAAVEGLDDGALGPALDLEARKAGLDLARRAATSRAGCPALAPDRLALVLGEVPPVVVAGPGDAAWPLDVEGVAVEERCQDVARRVVALFASAGAHRVPPILGDRLEAWPVRAQEPPPPSPPGEPVQGYLWASGAYRYEPAATLHAGAAGLEGGVALFHERLEAGLALAWQPVRTVGNDLLRSRVDAVDVGARLRGGADLGTTLLRAGVGVGAQWRRLRLRVATRSDELQAVAWIPVVSGEVEAAFRIGPFFRAALATTIQGYPTWTNYRYRGQPVYDGPRFAVDVALRIGAVFPRRAE